MGLIGVFIYFLGGTLWLQVGTYNFRSEVESLPRLARNVADYTAMCQHSPQSSDNSTPLGFEIRFLDDRHYVVEVVCTLIENSPIELKRGSLPPLITKMPGSSGIYYPLDQQTINLSAVRLFSINKELGISLSGDEVKVGTDIQAVIGDFPKAECAAFGYSCCTVAATVGQGVPLTGVVTDCAQNCFASCKSVPFIELFNSDPAYEPERREITMTSASLDVVFNYAISPKTVNKIHIDFGDGSTQDSTYPDGIFTHTFSCAGPCNYTVKLSAVSADGTASLDTNEAKIYIIRR